MHSIPFEKVSVREAKAVLDEGDLRDKQEKNWEHLRRLPGPSDLKLKEATYQWLLTLPTEQMIESMSNQPIRPAIGDDGDAAKRFGIRPARYASRPA